MPFLAGASVPSKLARCASVLLVPVLLAEACQPSFRRSSPPAPVITVADATRIARDKLELLDRYNQTGDVIFLDNTISGPARLIDRALIEARQYFKRPLQRKPRTIRKLTVFVPRQSDYPAYFLVLRETDDVDNDGNVTPDPAYFVDLFTRPAAEGAWTEILFVRLAGRDAVAGLQPDREGYLQPGSSDGGTEVLDRYVQYLNTYFRDGQPDESAGFAPGRYTSDSGSSFRDQQDRLRKAGVDMNLQVSRAPEAPAFSFATATRSTLVIGAVQGFMSLSGRSCLPQPPDRSLWGWLVPPGSYSSIRSRMLLMLLADVPNQSGGRPAPARVTAGFGPADVGASFTRCSAPSGA